MKNNKLNTQVIIIGAGIAGPALGIELKKIGLEPIIFESRDESQLENGSFLGLTPNGLNVLKDMIELNDLKDEYTPGKMVFYNAKNKIIGELDNDYQLDKYGAQTIQIKRATISRLLREAAISKGIEILYNHKLVEIKDNYTDKVEAVFENGMHIIGDMLIACDGINSKCRKIIFPNSEKPNYTSQISVGAIVENKIAFRKIDHIKMIFGDEAFFAYAFSNKDNIWWFDNYYRDKEPSKKEIESSLSIEIKEQLLEIHKNDPDEISQIIESTDEITEYPIYDIPQLEKWYKGRVCLVGDAAHATAPHIGQGASLALEDTVVLATCISHETSLETAFEQFQNMRQPRVEKLIKTARKVGKKKSKPNVIANFFRDLLLRHFIKFEKRKLDWIYSYNPNKYERIN